MKEALTGIQGVEPVINLMSLHDLIDLMQQESEINYRHVVLLPMAHLPCPCPVPTATTGIYERSTDRHSRCGTCH